VPEQSTPPPPKPQLTPPFSNPPSLISFVGVADTVVTVVTVFVFVVFAATVLVTVLVLWLSMQEQSVLTNATGCDAVTLEKVAHAPVQVLVLVTVTVVLARFAAVKRVDRLVVVTVTVVFAFVTGKLLLQ